MLYQTGGNADELMEKSKEAKKQITEMEEKEKDLINERDKILVTIGNIVHDSVPISQDEVNNAIVKEFGVLRQEEKLYNHVDLVGMLDIVNLEAGQTVAGGRGYYLINEGVLLNQALINYGLQFAYKRNYRPGERYETFLIYLLDSDYLFACSPYPFFHEAGDHGRVCSAKPV